MAVFDRSNLLLDLRGAAFRQFKSGQLQPYDDALAAYALWADLRPYHVCDPVVTVIRSEKTWRWCGGFAAVEHGAKDGLLGACVVKSKPNAGQIKAALWFEALQAPLLPTDHILRWRSLVARHLPHDLMEQFFGKRSMTPSSCARVLGRARQTVSQYWDVAHD